MPPQRLLSVGLAALVGVIGVFIGTIVTLHHRSVPPGGLILGLVLVAAWGVGLRVVSRNRLLAMVGLVGVFVAQLLLSGGFGGSFIVLAEPLGYALTLGVVIISVLVLAWPRFQAAARYDGNPSTEEGMKP